MGKRTHGHNQNSSRAYVSWVHMRQRCNNLNHHSYKNYGGRGITICKKWLKFENFLADMGERPKGLTLERKDNNGNYEPDNCKWATRIEQRYNTRQLKLNPNKVKIIKILLNDGYDQPFIGKLFDVGSSQISRIATGKRWVNVTI